MRLVMLFIGSFSSFLHFSVSLKEFLFFRDLLCNEYLRYTQRETHPKLTFDSLTQNIFRK